MFSAARTAPLTRSGPRPLPIAVSLVAHAGVLGLVVFGPAPRTSREPRSLYDQVIKPHEHELVWYSFRQKLPEVSPREMQNPRAPGAEFKSPDQTIISDPEQGARGTQLIWRPLPQIRPQPEVASPNILAFRLPEVSPPPPAPSRRLFVAPDTKQRQPAAPAPRLPEPPKMQARVDVKQNPALLANLVAALENRPKPKNFTPPVSKPERRVAAPALPEAPGLATSLRSERVPLLAESMAAPLANKPQARTFIPPPTSPHTAASPAALPDAPQLATPLARANGVGRNPAIQDISAAALANRPKARPFLPPPVSGNGTGSNPNGTAPLAEEAPALNMAGMPSGNVNVAIVGLHPSGHLNGPLPDASHEAKFSAGPDANGGAGAPASKSASGLSVPGLLVHGGNADGPGPTVRNPVLLARAAPTSRETLEAAARLAHTAGASVPDDPPAAEIHLAPPPDLQFNGRDVYTLAVQMPNITSYVGSWIMWFAERTPSGARSMGDLRPPVPVHKVDPKYYPAAIAERVEGKVQVAGVIRTTGHVELVRVVKSVDPRLDTSAREALLKWEFEPAERNGKPVEVDLVAEIPFLLAPQAKP